MAQDIARAVEAEKAAAVLRRKAVDAQAQLERTRTLVEEAIARVGRLRAQLEAAGAHRTRSDAPPGGQKAPPGRTLSNGTKTPASAPAPAPVSAPRQTP
jgi:hypothetical protein